MQTTIQRIEATGLCRQLECDIIIKLHGSYNTVENVECVSGSITKSVCTRLCPDFDLSEIISYGRTAWSSSLRSLQKVRPPNSFIYPPDNHSRGSSGYAVDKVLYCDDNAQKAYRLYCHPSRILHNQPWTRDDLSIRGYTTVPPVEIQYRQDRFV